MPDTTNKGGAPLGNQNGKKGSIWRDAIMKAVHEIDPNSPDSAKKLRSLARKLVENGLDGDNHALQQIGDRLDGKPTQAIERTDTRTITLIERKIVQVEEKPPIEGEIVTKQLDGEKND